RVAIIYRSDPHVRPTIPLRNEGELTTIGRPCWMDVRRRIVRELDRGAARSGHDPNVTLTRDDAVERDPPPIRRVRRMRGRTWLVGQAASRSRRTVVRKGLHPKIPFPAESVRDECDRPPVWCKRWTVVSKAGQANFPSSGEIKHDHIRVVQKCG